MTLPEIIAALEAADGPSRELDAGIALAIGAFCHLVAGVEGCWIERITAIRDTDQCSVVIRNARGGSIEYTQDLPRYTASLDAALTLVPAKSAWAAGVDEDGQGCADLPRQRLLVFAATPAIALCIAALKARAKDVT